jgi:hypothetical protein
MTEFIDTPRKNGLPRQMPVPRDLPKDQRDLLRLQSAWFLCTPAEGERFYKWATRQLAVPAMKCPGCDTEYEAGDATCETCGYGFEPDGVVS